MHEVTNRMDAGAIRGELGTIQFGKVCLYLQLSSINAASFFVTAPIT